MSFIIKHKESIMLSKVFNFKFEVEKIRFEDIKEGNVLAFGVFMPNGDGMTKHPFVAIVLQKYENYILCTNTTRILKDRFDYFNRIICKKLEESREPHKKVR